MCEIMYFFLICIGCLVLYIIEDSDLDVEVGRCYIVWFLDGYVSYEIDLRVVDVFIDY